MARSDSPCRRRSALPARPPAAPGTTVSDGCPSRLASSVPAGPPGGPTVPAGPRTTFIDVRRHATAEIMSRPGPSPSVKRTPAGLNAAARWGEPRSRLLGPKRHLTSDLDRRQNLRHCSRHDK